MKTNGVAKVDVTRPAGDNVVAEASFTKNGKKRFGGECIFVPAPAPTPAAEEGKGQEEDDGWLLTYVFEHATNSSHLLILDARTLEEVGAIFNVTRERVRQIESKALRKLRHPSRARKLQGYVGLP